MSAALRFRPPFPEFGILPERTDDPTAVAALVRRHGAAVLVGAGRTEAEAVAVPRAVFGDAVLAVPPAAEVREAGGQDRRYAGISQHNRLKCHTDGFSYGDLYPDYFALVCEDASPEGGESMLLDGDALLDWVLADPVHAPFGERLQTVPVEQTEPGKRRSTAPMVGRSASGRRMFRRFPEQSPAPDAADPEADAAMIYAWHQLIDDVSLFAPRFKLEPGDAVVIDNYRVFHGREPYSDMARKLWRVWMWTTAGQGVPDGMLHSDSRYAGAPT
jgi:gamma-butyrobetaine dioxygenase